MKINYIILSLFVLFSCGGDATSDDKKVNLLEKKPTKNLGADKNVIKAKVPKSKKISSKRTENKVASKRQPKKIKKPKKRVNNSNTQAPFEKVKAPDFLLSDLDGNVIDFSAYEGQVVMLTFWGTWCGPCRKEIPDFIKLYDEHNAEGLEIVGIAVQSGTAENIKRFSEYYKINYPILTDIGENESYKAFRDYGTVTGVGTRAVPTTFLIDREGYIVKTYRGARPGSVFYRDLKPYL